MADKIIADEEWENEFGKTRLVIFVLLHLNKTKRPGSYVIKSKFFVIKKEKAALWEIRFSTEKLFPVEASF